LDRESNNFLLATSLFKILHAHRPEDKASKKKRLLEAAQKTEPQADAKKPKFVKMGINHVTSLVESKKAKLVVIAHDVDPIEVSKIYYFFKSIVRF
jgi:large subunit ribosomal protein L7Ae